MKTRHAAALALVGWYLMVLTDPDKPYWKGWTAVRSFQSESECKTVAYTLAEWGWNHSAVYRVRPFYDEHQTFPPWQSENAYCTDDPKKGPD